MEKNWKLFYYRYNLTEQVEEKYYTEIWAFIRAMWLNKRYGLKIWVSEIENK